MRAFSLPRRRGEGGRRPDEGFRPVGDDVRSLTSNADCRVRNAEPSQSLLTSAPTSQGNPSPQPSPLLRGREREPEHSGRSPSPRPGSAGSGKPADRVSNQRTVRMHERASKRLPLPRRERAGVRVKPSGVSSAANAPLSLCPASNCDAPLTGPIPARQSTSPVSACPMPQSKTSNTTPINC